MWPFSICFHFAGTGFRERDESKAFPNPESQRAAFRGINFETDRELVLLYNVLLEYRFIPKNTIESKARQVNSDKLAVNEELRDRPTSTWSLLQTMTTETVA